MKNSNKIGLLLFMLQLLGVCTLSARTVNFDMGWKFALMPADTTVISNWRTVNLPHDWSIEGSYEEKNGDWQNGFLPCGVGLYRKYFSMPEVASGQRVKILFDGVYRCSDVWINGHHLGYRPTGFLGFEYDLTPYLKHDNMIEVRVDHSKHFSNRSYSGSGIYRHVWLNIVNSVHVDKWGINFSSYDVSPDKSSYQAVLAVNNDGLKKRKIDLRISLSDAQGKVVSVLSQRAVASPGISTDVMFRGMVNDVHLWSPQSPYLYRLTASIYEKGKLKDEKTIKVGFRSVVFDGEKGLLLNGQQTKLKGVCERSTAGALGAAVPYKIMSSRIAQLKAMGCNAIRTAHHPFAPEFYAICDSLGMMVMNEAFDGWETPKAQADYGLFFEEWWQRDVTDFVYRDRSHACVILWSIGNEVVNPTRTTQKKLIDFFYQLDPTRLTTQGGLDPTRGMEGDKLRTQLGVKGFNGDGEEIGTFQRFHNNYPDIPIVGTEVPHTLHTRGVYRTRTHWRLFDFPAVWEQRNKGLKVNREDYIARMHPIPNLTEEEVFPEEVCTQYYKNGKYYPIENHLPATTYYQSSYDNASVRISARDSWLEVEDNDYISGTFRWTGFDYLGESNGWPSRFMNCGVIDVCGFPKDHYYLYQAMWSDEPMVHLLPHWTHKGKEGVAIPVVAYSNARQVELFLNGKSLGAKSVEDYQAMWYVPYQPGKLTVVARNGGMEVAQCTQQTAGQPVGLKLTSDASTMKANQVDVIQIAVDVVDEHGVMYPYANNELQFTVAGGAEILGVDNGDPIDLSDYQSNRRKAFRGKAMLWIRSNGENKDITISVAAQHIKTATLVIPIEK